MTDTRLKTLDALEAQIAASDETARAALMPRLRALVTELEAEGLLPPGSARAHLTDAVDDALDDQFDNMPI